MSSNIQDLITGFKTPIITFYNMFQYSNYEIIVIVIGFFCVVLFVCVTDGFCFV